MPRSMPSATCRHSATPEGGSCKLMAWKRLWKASVKSSSVTKQSWHSLIKLSIIIDNLNSARFHMAVSDEDSKLDRRKAAMKVLAHATTAEIAVRLDRMALPAHENLRAPENGLVM